jgi:uncharacterized membrane protein
MCIITHGLDRVNKNVYLCVVSGLLGIFWVWAGTSSWGIFRVREKAGCPFQARLFALVIFANKV